MNHKVSTASSSALVSTVPTTLRTSSWNWNSNYILLLCLYGAGNLYFQNKRMVENSSPDYITVCREEIIQRALDLPFETKSWSRNVLRDATQTEQGTFTTANRNMAFA